MEKLSQWQGKVRSEVNVINYFYVYKGRVELIDQKESTMQKPA